MNHIYRSIWNEKTGTFVAVSENTKTGGKKASTGASVVVGAGFALKALAVLLMLAFGSNSYALPANGTVVAGSATITGSTSNMTINQSSQNAVLNWQSFNIGTGEAVRFVQPNSNSVALNRVLGADASSILGTLSANGKVFIVNPNGILFGKGASVNVGGLVASSRNISDSDFMAGNYKFVGAGNGSILNQGAINVDGGYVALLGANVSNEGTINARLGSIALAAGNAITLDVAGDGLLNVAVDQGSVNALVQNGGMIQANGGQVLLTAQAAGNLLQTVVNNTGIIQAQTIENHNGTIKLLSDMQSGTVNVSGKLDASAPNGGNGGAIETSAAHVKVQDSVRITTAAAQGLTGSWLIDPVDFTIAATGGDMTGATLTTNLAGGNVTIQSTSGGSGSAGDVNVNDAVSWSANKLTLNAQNNININANMNASATASLALEFGQGAVAAGNTSNIITTGASVNLPASTTNFTTKQGSNGSVKAYTVITSLGAAGSTTTTDLQGMNGNLVLNYALGANIDATATSGWNAGAGFMPVGGAGCWPCTSISGTFDGLGHTVSALTVNRPGSSMIGLFGYGTAASVIRNIGLNGGSFSGASYTGTLIGRSAGTVFNSFSTANVTGTGYVGGLVGRNYGTVSNSYATGDVIGSRVGGLVGRNDSGTVISNSHATGSVNGSQYAGGLVGDSDTTTISNSYATGNVISGWRHAGGLVGRMSSGSISNSYATGTVSGVGWTGGLVGDADSVTISNSYATGSVTSTGNNTGGLIGYGNSVSVTNTYATGAVSGTANVGGFVGFMNYGSTVRSYSVGAVSGSSAVGGLVGGGYGPSFSNSYWNTDTSGQGSSYGGTGLTSVQMQTAANFGGLNFTTTPGAAGNNWVMVDADGTLNNAGGATGGTRPMLASEYSTNITNAHQLQLMAMNLSANYTLGQNINASTTGNSTDVWSSAGFRPVGNFTTKFSGTFDGLGHSISNLTINLPSTMFVGLFGAATGTLKNVSLVNENVTGNYGVGGLTGYTNSSISNSSVTGTITGANLVGGLVGRDHGSTSNSFSTATVVASANTGGGLIGKNYGTISSSYATGSVSGSQYNGGLAGINQGTITNSYAMGPVTGTSGSRHWSGGLVGINYSNINNSYATGAVIGGTGGTFGGLVGKNYGTVTKSFWDTTTSAQATSNGGLGMTTAQMMTQANFTSATAANGNVNPAWDSTNTWVAYDTHTYPLLRSFMTPLTVTANGATKTYDSTAYSGGNGVTYSVTPDGNLLGSVSYSGSAQGDINAGSYAITPGGFYSTGQQGYAITYVSGALIVSAANLTLSTSNVSKTYDGGLSAAGTATVTSGTLFGSDSISGGTFAFTDKNVGSGNKTVSTSGVTVSDGNSGGNYNVSYVNNTTSTILKANLTIGTSNVSKTYDGGLSAAGTATITSGSLFGSDSISGGTFAFTDKNVGSGNKTVTTSGVIVSDGNSGGNYNVNYANNTASTILKANLTLGTSNVSKTYDGSLTAVGTATVTSGTLFGSDSLSGGTFAFTNMNAGSGNKTVSASGVTVNDGNSGSNYNVSYANNTTSTITPYAVSLTGTRTYDGTLNVAASGLTIGTLANGETLALTGTGTVASKNIGIAKTVTLGTLALADGTGLASNYTFTGGTQTTNVTAANLTLGTSNVSKTYDGGLSAAGTATITSGSLFGSDSISGGTFAFTDKNVGSGNKT
ncbi:MAG TPA: YDG domain-containing protein, partial [Burkholderiaceae bacterium]